MHSIIIRYTFCSVDLTKKNKADIWSSMNTFLAHSLLKGHWLKFVAILDTGATILLKHGTYFKNVGISHWRCQEWTLHVIFSQALGYTLWFLLFSLKLNIFPFSASILTFSTQNHLTLKYFKNVDTTHFFYTIIQPIFSIL